MYKYYKFILFSVLIRKFDLS